MSDLTTKAIFEEKIAVELTTNPDKVAGINAVYQFNVTGDNGGNYFVDLTGDAPAVGAGSADNANCTITVADSDFVDLVTGKTQWPDGFHDRQTQNRRRHGSRHEIAEDSRLIFTEYRIDQGGLVCPSFFAFRTKKDKEITLLKRKIIFMQLFVPSLMN